MFCLICYTCIHNQWNRNPFFIQKKIFFFTHILEEDAEVRVTVWVNGSLEHWKENVLQHLAKVGHKVPASEDVTKIEEVPNIMIKQLHNMNKVVHS